MFSLSARLASSRNHRPASPLSHRPSFNMVEARWPTRFLRRGSVNKLRCYALLMPRFADFMLRARSPREGRSIIRQRSLMIGAANAGMLNEPATSASERAACALPRPSAGRGAAQDKSLMLSHALGFNATPMRCASMSAAATPTLRARFRRLMSWLMGIFYRYFPLDIWDQADAGFTRGRDRTMSYYR